MGNQVSGSTGNLFIQTDQPFYMSGDTVTGKVHVNMLETYPANVLQLKIKGFEECEWKEQLTREKQEKGADGTMVTKTETYYETHKGKNTFYCHKFPLYIWSGFSYMPSGQFTFPFQFKLLDALPGTYSEKGIEKGGEYKAIIRYKVKAVIEGANQKSIKNKQDLVVREPLKNIVTSQYGENLVKPTTCCCISQGQSHIKCSFEKNVYIPGETARMLADLDNSQCQLAIKQLKCSFIKHLKLTSNSGKELRIDRNIQSKSLSGVAPGEKAVDSNRKSTELILKEQNGKEIQPSTHGRYVNCDYKLNILADLEGCICCSSEPEVTVPIQLVSLPPPNYGIVSTPPNWNPQVFEIKSFAFSNDCMYTKGSNVGISINANVPLMLPPQMNVQMNIPPPQMTIQVNTTQQMNAPPPQMQMQTNNAPQQNVQMNVPPPNMNMNVQTTSYQNQNAQISMGMPGMQMKMNLPPPDMSVSINSDDENNSEVQMNIGFNEVSHQPQMMNMNINFQ